MTIAINDTKEKIKNLHKEESVKIKCKFICHEPKGGNVTFSYKKFPQDPIEKYTLYDGQVYELPKCVVKHLNSCGWEIHAHLLDADGQPIQGIGKKEHRFTLQPIDFI